MRVGRSASPLAGRERGCRGEAAGESPRVVDVSFFRELPERQERDLCRRGSDKAVAQWQRWLSYQLMVLTLVLVLVLAPVLVALAVAG